MFFVIDIEKVAGDKRSSLFDVIKKWYPICLSLRAHTSLCFRQTKKLECLFWASLFCYVTMVKDSLLDVPPFVLPVNVRLGNRVLSGPNAPAFLHWLWKTFYVTDTQSIIYWRHNIQQNDNQQNENSKMEFYRMTSELWHW